MFVKGFSLLLLGLGVFVLMQVLMPILAFKTWEVTNFDQSQILLDPNPKVLSGDLIKSDVLGISVENVNNFPRFISKNGSRNLPFLEFKLTIPKINLYDTKVRVDSNEIDDYLAHLPGTALPGEKGNVFVSGHSAIYAAFAEKERAYFASLPSVKKGDEVLIEALGQRYTYEVMGFKVVDPKDVSVINPPDSNGRYLTLMTCVPPGFNTKRLVVLAKLKQS